MAPFYRMIRYCENERIKKLCLLLNTDRSIGLFGAGGYATTLIEELRSWGGIQPDFCVVDDCYYTPDKQCNGVKVISVRECNDVQKNSIVLTGFGMTYQNEKAELERLRALLDPSIDLIDFEDQYIAYFYNLDYPFVIENAGMFQQLYEMLEEDSRPLLIDYINGRISGNLHKMGVYADKNPGDYRWELLSHRVNDGTIIDCGAFDGSSSLQFNAFLHGRNHILALECDRNNFALLCKNTQKAPNITPIPKGVWNHSTLLSLQGEGETANLGDFRAEASTDVIEVVAIDDLDVGKVDAIIMDVEGAELTALHGAKRTIESFCPALAIRLYHKAEDFIDIPRFLRSIDSFHKYRYYLRYDCRYRGAADLTLYAV